MIKRTSEIFYEAKQKLHVEFHWWIRQKIKTLQRIFKAKIIWGYLKMMRYNIKNTFMIKVVLKITMSFWVIRTQSLKSRKLSKRKNCLMSITITISKRKMKRRIQRPKFYSIIIIKFSIHKNMTIMAIIIEQLRNMTIP